MLNTQELLVRASSALSSHRFHFINEEELQRGIAQVLDSAGLAFERERWFGRDRLDFWIENCVALEVKVAGSLADVTRQCHRYLQREEIKALVLFTTRSLHRGLPDTISGKPLRVVVSVGAF